MESEYISLKTKELEALLNEKIQGLDNFTENILTLEKEISGRIEELSKLKSIFENIKIDNLKIKEQIEHQKKLDQENYKKAAEEKIKKRKEEIVQEMIAGLNKEEMQFPMAVMHLMNTGKYENIELLIKSSIINSEIERFDPEKNPQELLVDNIKSSIIMEARASKIDNLCKDANIEIENILAKENKHICPNFYDTFITNSFDVTCITKKK